MVSYLVFRRSHALKCTSAVQKVSGILQCVLAAGADLYVATLDLIQHL